METAWFGMETFGMETAKHGVFRSFGWPKMAQNWTHAAWPGQGTRQRRENSNVSLTSSVVAQQLQGISRSTLFQSH